MNMSSIIRFILTIAFSAAFSPSSPPLLRQPPQFAQNKILARQRQQFIGSTNTRTRPSFSIFANNKNNNVDDLPPIEERVLSCLPYMLPLLDGAHFGVFIEQRIAPLHILKLVFLQPFLNIYELIPFSSLILFLGFTFVTRNQGLSRDVRFNFQQAILIDIALIFPELFGGLAKELPLGVVEPATNFVYYFYVTVILYSMISNLLGAKPDGIPFISSASDQQIGPM